MVPKLRRTLQTLLGSLPFCKDSLLRLCGTIVIVANPAGLTPLLQAIAEAPLEAANHPYPQVANPAGLSPLWQGKQAFGDEDEL